MKKEDGTSECQPPLHTDILVTQREPEDSWGFPIFELPEGIGNLVMTCDQVLLV